MFYLLVLLLCFCFLVGLKTPPDMKLKVIQVLKRMNHNLTLATQVSKVKNISHSIHFYFKVRSVCLQLLKSHPALTFVTVVLWTLTELAISTLVHAPDQVQLILYR